MHFWISVLINDFTSLGPPEETRFNKPCKYMCVCFFFLGGNTYHLTTQKWPPPLSLPQRPCNSNNFEPSQATLSLFLLKNPSFSKKILWQDRKLLNFFMRCSVYREKKVLKTILVCFVYCIATFAFFVWNFPYPRPKVTHAITPRKAPPPCQEKFWPPSYGMVARPCVPACLFIFCITLVNWSWFHQGM